LDNPSKSVTEIMFKGELRLLHPFALILPTPFYVIIPFLYSQPTTPLIYSKFFSLHRTLFSCTFLSIFPFSLHTPPLFEVIPPSHLRLPPPFIHLPSFFLRLSSIFLPSFRCLSSIFRSESTFHLSCYLFPHPPLFHLPLLLPQTLLRPPLFRLPYFFILFFSISFSSSSTFQYSTPPIYLFLCLPRLISFSVILPRITSIFSIFVHFSCFCFSLSFLLPYHHYLHTFFAIAIILF
jgi:hypothetical protein